MCSFIECFGMLPRFLLVVLKCVYRSRSECDVVRSGYTASQCCGVETRPHVEAPHSPAPLSTRAARTDHCKLSLYTFCNQTLLNLEYIILTRAIEQNNNSS